MQIAVNGVTIYYEQHGDIGPQVLLLHGWGCDTSLFAPITLALSRQMRATVIDFPAHGKSTRPPEPWGVPEFAELTRQLILRLGLAPCHLIAHSFGGRVALYIASHWPELVGRMMITGGAGIRKPASQQSAKRSQHYKRLKTGCEWLAKTHLFGDLPEHLAQKLRQRFGSADYNALDEEMRKTFVKVINLDLRPLLPQVQAPTLLVWGSNDTETPLWMGEVMAHEIPDAGLVVFENGTHYAYLEQWQRFVTIAQHFLLKE